MIDPESKGKNKVIKFVCDLCKLDIQDSLNGMDTLRLGTPVKVIWHICKPCQPKLEESLGEGMRVLSPQDRFGIKK